MQKTNILVLTSTFPTFSSTDTVPPFVYELSKGISEINQFNIIVLTPHRKDSKICEEKDGLKIYRFKYGFTSLCDGAMLPNLRKNKLLWLQVPFFFLFYLINLIKIIKKEDIKIIHAHWIIPQGLIAVIYKKIFNKNIKILLTTHGSDIFKLQNKIVKNIKKFVLNNANVTTAVSNEAKKEIEKISKNATIHIIPMGVDDNIFNPDKYDEIIKKQYNINGPFLLFVGRLVEEKGIKYLIDAMLLVTQKNKFAKLLIIGNGILEKELKEQTEKLNLQNNIYFLGGVKYFKLPTYYATADIFIGPSTSEGLPTTFIESLLSKTCVITSELPTLSDIIIHNKTGLQINTKDANILSRIILQVISDKNIRDKLSEQGYQHAKDNFSLKIISKKYNDLLLKL